MDGIVFINLKFKLIKISIFRKWWFNGCKFEKTRKLGNYWVMSFPRKKLIEEYKIEASKSMDEAYAEYKRSQKNE